MKNSVDTQLTLLNVISNLNNYNSCVQNSVVNVRVALEAY